jgi:hypothetical protein
MCDIHVNGCQFAASVEVSDQRTLASVKPLVT